VSVDVPALMAGVLLGYSMHRALGRMEREDERRVTEQATQRRVADARELERVHAADIQARAEEVCSYARAYIEEQSRDHMTERGGLLVGAIRRYNDRAQQAQETNDGRKRRERVGDIPHAAGDDRQVHRGLP
jgi:hypothetical protein